MHRLSVLALLTFAAGTAPAFAACQGESHFQCDIGAKRLEICQSGPEVSYRFGPVGKPEMQISTDIPDLDYRPWPGVGRAIHEAVAFHNDGVTYEVWTSFDRLDETAMAQGGVTVLRGEKILATLSCRPESLDAGLDMLFEAKTAAGQCWSLEDRAWTDANGACP